MRASHALAVLAVSALLVSGCSGSDSDQAGDKLSKDVDGKGRTITIWDYETETSAFGPGWAKARTLLEQETGVKVKYEFKSFEQLRTAASQIFNSDSAPDVVEFNKGNATSGLLSSQGLLTNLDEVVKFYGWDKLVPGALQTTARYNDKGIMGSGHWYGVPNYGEFTQVYYNRKMFDQYGVTVPKTYDEFKAVLQKFKDAGVTPVATAGGEYPLQQLFYQFALSKADRDWVNKFELYQGKASFSDPAWTYAANELKSYVDNGYIGKDVAGLKAEDAGTSFMSAKNPILFSGSWWYGRFISEIKGFDWGTFLFPDSKLTMGSAGNHWVVPTKSKNKDLAYKFIDITMRREIQNMIGNGGSIPLAADLNGITDPKSRELVQNFKTVVDRDGLSFYPDWPTATFYDDLVAATQELINGTKTPQAMLDQLQKKYDAGVAEIK